MCPASSNSRSPLRSQPQEVTNRRFPAPADRTSCSWREPRASSSAETNQSERNGAPNRQSPSLPKSHRLPRPLQAALSATAHSDHGASTAHTVGPSTRQQLRTSSTKPNGSGQNVAASERVPSGRGLVPSGGLSPKASQGIRHGRPEPSGSATSHAMQQQTDNCSMTSFLSASITLYGDSDETFMQRIHETLASRRPLSLPGCQTLDRFSLTSQFNGTSQLQNGTGTPSSSNRMMLVEGVPSMSSSVQKLSLAATPLPTLPENVIEGRSSSEDEQSSCWRRLRQL